jgi:sigma-B regulation protein RsbU (phosphoserine phosphatase)
VLGIIESIQLEEDHVVLAAGDRLVLYTDGLTEAPGVDGSLFGEERLYALLAGLPSHLSAREMADHILAEQRRFTGGAEASDDTTIMVLRVLAPEPSSRPGDDVGQLAEATVV